MTILILVGLLVAVLVWVGSQEEKAAQNKKKLEALEREASADVPDYMPPPLEEPYTPEAPVEPVLRRPGRPRKAIVSTEVSPEAVPGRRSRKVH